MEKLKGFFKGIWGKFKALSKGAKIILIVAIVSVIFAIGFAFFYNAANKYQVLFSDLDPSDAQVVTSQLEERKVPMKVKGSSILVDKKDVDRLRLDLAPELSEGSKGYELMDNSGSFGMTDEEFNLKKQRMIQGELEKTIKSFPQVEAVRVHITPAKDSVFVEEKEPGKAAVILNIAGDLKEEQVKSIVSLVSGSTQNIPKENVEVIDQRMNLLSQGIDFGGKEGFSGSSIDTQYASERDYETKLQKEVISMLEPVLGKGKVRANINVDLDFDSKQKTETVIDPNKVIVSQQTISESANSSDGATSESPVDNNMSNTIKDDKNTSGNKRDEQNTNYESGKTETKTISAPGEVKRLTASVIVDNPNLDLTTKDLISESVGNAVGLKTERGDKISVAGMEFDPAVKAENQAQIDALNAQIKKDKITKFIMLGVGIVVLIVIIVLIVKALKRRKEDKEEKEANRLNVVVGDEFSGGASYKPVDFNNENEKVHIENEIKNYAKEKPDQVVEVIKSWLSENEG